MSTRNRTRARVSRSCANCRAVKRRCDQQVPQCGQCTRQGEKCPGYRSEWDLIFRDQTSRTIRRSSGQDFEENPEQQANKVAFTGGNPSSPPAHSFGLGINEMNDNYLLELQYFGTSQMLFPSMGPLLPQAVSSSPTMRNQVFSYFFSEYFPQQMDAASDLNKLQFIISAISDLPQKGPMLEQSLSALACIFLGKIHYDEQVLQHGLKL